MWPVASAVTAAPIQSRSLIRSPSCSPASFSAAASSTRSVASIAAKSARSSPSSPAERTLLPDALPHGPHTKPPYIKRKKALKQRNLRYVEPEQAEEGASGHVRLFQLKRWQSQQERTRRSGRSIGARADGILVCRAVAMASACSSGAIMMDYAATWTV
jgi:hypothetical protein